MLSVKGAGMFDWGYWLQYWYICSGLSTPGADEEAHCNPARSAGPTHHRAGGYLRGI